MLLLEDMVKLTAFYPGADVDSIREWAGVNGFFVGLGLTDYRSQHNFLKDLGDIRTSESLGCISFANKKEYARKVKMMLESLVIPGLQQMPAGA